MRQLVVATLALCFSSTAFSANRFELVVTEPTGIARRQAPVTSGVPFARGELRSADRVALFLAESPDKQVPLQTEILSRWPDGSVKWLLLDFVAGSDSDAGR